MGLAADCDDLESQQLPYSCGSGVVKLELCCAHAYWKNSALQLRNLQK